MDTFNDLECVSVYDRDTNQLLYHEWTFTLIPEVISLFVDDVFPLIEVEILQGSRQLLPDGRTAFKCQLDERKTNMFKQMLFEPTLAYSEN